MHPRPDLTILQLADDEIQIGIDPRWSIRVNSLTGDQMTALLALNGNPPVTAHLLADLGKPLLSTLASSGALLSEVPLDAAGQEHSNPDARAWAHLDPGARGMEKISQRSSRSVGILGLGRTGLRIAQGLATAGVGRLILDDDGPVQHTDLGLGGHSVRSLGLPRRTSATQLLADNDPGNTTFQAVPLRAGTALTELDIVVVVARGALDPSTMWRLMAEGVPYLPVVWGEAGVCLGPVVLPGSTPCLQCVDLARRDADPAWPLIAAQLVTSAKLHCVEESMLAGIASALVVSQVLSLLDDRQPSWTGATVDLALPDAQQRIRSWAPHPECGCLTLAE